MLLYAVRRLLWSIPVLLIASILVFVAVKASTDPASSLRRPGVTAADVQRFRSELHLNDSGVEQYKSWITNFLHGDLGRNLRNKPVWPDLRDAIVIGRASAVLAASIFHDGTHTIGEAKAFLARAGIPMRVAA